MKLGQVNSQQSASLGHGSLEFLKDHGFYSFAEELVS